MKTYQVVLCDKDEEFVLALLNYFNRSTQLPLLAMAFTKEDEMLVYLTMHKVDIIVTEVLPVAVQDTVNRMTPVLYSYTSEAANRTNGDYSIFKYSPASEYIRRLIRIISEEQGVVRSSGSCTCMAVYSPLGRCGKTMLAQALCRYYGGQEAECRKTIYIGMEEYGTWEYENHKMEELLYFIKQRALNISMKMKSMASQVHGYDCIASAASYEELKELNLDDFEWVLGSLRNEGIYDCVLMDVGSASLTGIEVFQKFDVVYMPYLQDSISEQKWKSFYDYLNKKDIKPEMLEHWYPVYVPPGGISEREIREMEKKRQEGRLENLRQIQK